MEKEQQLSKQKVDENEDGGGGEDLEFYEKIEAPKFVDFTVPEPYRPDDRYWFCLRVGCDQKHEEEIDPEAVYKNFVLRVMAARSPNIRLQKALNRKALSTNTRCPLSAPAKPSKPRVSRLAVVSSISQQMVDAKVKVKPLAKLNSTPNVKAKQVSAKYLTTPRNKKCLENPNSFRSVQNPKPTTVLEPKNRLVAKALVFHSPKKAISVKKSSELRTPLTKICEGMKRLQITSERKRALGHSRKSSKDIKRNPNKTLPLDPSRKHLHARKDKSRAKDSLHPQSLEDQETQSLRFTKGKDTENLNKHSGSKAMIENDSSDMEIDVKSRDGSVLGSSRNEGNGDEKHLETPKTSGNFDDMGSTQEEAIRSIDEPLPTVMLTGGLRKAPPPATKNSDISEDSGGEMNSISNSGQSDLEENDLPIIGDQNGKGNESSEGNEQEEKTNPSSEQGGSSKDSTESEIMDSDDKENVSTSDDNRNFNHNNNQFGGKILGRQDICKNTKKVARKMDNNLKEGPTAGNVAQGIRYKKPKPTNPKPFRLRTDERGILKEANLERKIHLLAPPKEIATVSKFLGGNSQRKIQRNEKSLELRKYNNDMHEGSEKEIEKNLQKDAPWIRTRGLKTLKGQVGSKITMVAPKRHSASTYQKPIPVISELEYSKDNVSKKSENNTTKTKSPSLQRQLVSPQGVASTKAMVSYITPGQQLSVINETSSTISRSKEEGKVRVTKPSTCSASRSSSRGRRPATIPKEPNFHSVHTPKSCTRKVS